VLGLLAHREYETLAAMRQGKNVTAADIQAAVESYGRILVKPPDGELPTNTSR